MQALDGAISVWRAGARAQRQCSFPRHRRARFFLTAISRRTEIEVELVSLFVVKTFGHATIGELRSGTVRTHHTASISRRRKDHSRRAAESTFRRRSNQDGAPRASR